MARYALLVSLALPVAGCPMMEGKDCTALAAASSLVHVVGPDGEPMVAEVTAVDEDGNDVVVSCADLGDPAECTDWIAGYEVVGRITITGNTYDGCNYGSGTVTVDVPLDDDGCHVVQQEVTLTMDDWTDLDCLPA